MALTRTLFLLLLLLLPSPAAAGEGNSSSLTDGLIDRVMTAYGGRERLKAVKALPPL